jgi:ABC-2 type transport system ATP-binding protein
MTVADYLDYAANLEVLVGDQTKIEIRRVIKATDIGDKILAHIGTLSRGYKQRVGVAQAILGQPKLLIIDRPTNGMDPNQTQQMRKLIREISQFAAFALFVIFWGETFLARSIADVHPLFEIRMYLGWCAG